MAKCFFLAGPGEEDILLAAMLVYGIYAFHCHARHAHANVAESPAAVLRLVGEVGWPARASKIFFEHQVALSRLGVRL